MIVLTVTASRRFTAPSRTPSSEYLLEHRKSCLVVVLLVGHRRLDVAYELLLEIAHLTLQQLLELRHLLLFRNGLISQVRDSLQVLNLVLFQFLDPLLLLVQPFDEVGLLNEKQPKLSIVLT